MKTEKERKHLPVPPSVQRIVDSRPHLHPWLRFDLDAFFYLSRSRPVHMGGVGFITEQSIESFARLRGVPTPSDALDELMLNIRAMDDLYMELQREEDDARRRADDEKSKKGNKGRR